MFFKKYRLKYQRAPWEWGWADLGRQSVLVFGVHSRGTWGILVGKVGAWPWSSGNGFVRRLSQRVVGDHVLSLKVISKTVFPMYAMRRCDRRLTRGQGCQECPAPTVLVTRTLPYWQTETTRYCWKDLLTWKFAVFITETFGSLLQEWVSTWWFINKSRNAKHP